MTEVGVELRSHFSKRSKHLAKLQWSSEVTIGKRNTWDSKYSLASTAITTSVLKTVSSGRCLNQDTAVIDWIVGAMKMTCTKLSFHQWPLRYQGKLNYVGNWWSKHICGQRGQPDITTCYCLYFSYKNRQKRQHNGRQYKHHLWKLGTDG